jgi:hypothetical protein
MLYQLFDLCIHRQYTRAMPFLFGLLHISLNVAREILNTRFMSFAQFGLVSLIRIYTFVRLYRIVIQDILL